MNELIKIREISVKYDISARTLRYYETWVLLKAPEAVIMRTGCMMKTAVRRLEQNSDPA